MNMRPLHARSVLSFVAFMLLGGCRSGLRCATCGMKIDPISPWVSYLTVSGKEEAFDTPTCALTAWRKAPASVTDARFREYYSQEWRDVKELRFVRGSDVVGPMGPDRVPINAGTAPRFARDHNGAPPQTAEEIVRGDGP